MPLINPRNIPKTLTRHVEDAEDKLLNISASYFFPVGLSSAYTLVKSMMYPHIKDVSSDLYVLGAALGLPTAYHLASKYPGAMPYLLNKGMFGKNPIQTKIMSNPLLLDKLGNIGNNILLLTNLSKVAYKNSIEILESSIRKT